MMQKGCPMIASHIDEKETATSSVNGAARTQPRTHFPRPSYRIDV